MRIKLTAGGGLPGARRSGALSVNARTCTVRIFRSSDSVLLPGVSVKTAALCLTVCFLCFQLAACGGKRTISGNGKSGYSQSRGVMKNREDAPQAPAVPKASVPASSYSSSSRSASPSTGTASSEPRYHEVQMRSDSVRINMGSANVNMPLPSGFSAVDSGDARRKQVSGWFIPGQNVYAVYERAGAKRSGSGGRSLFGEPLLIVSSRPEMTDLNMSSAVFEGMKKDMLRDNGNYDQGKWDEFMRYTASRYKDSERLKHKLGVTGMGKAHASVGYIIKEPTTGPSSVPIQASHKTLVPPTTPGASTALANAEFNISMHNIVLVSGRCFNVYYNARLRSKDDYDQALRENARIMRELESRL